jgi:hypothetical protein
VKAKRFCAAATCSLCLSKPVSPNQCGGVVWTNSRNSGAAFDFPAKMTYYADYGASVNYGTQANFQDNYELTDAFISNLKNAVHVGRSDLDFQGSSVCEQVADFDALLTSQGVAHTLLTQTKGAPDWSSGWLPMR